MLSYKQIAKRLGIPAGTLQRKLLKFNACNPVKRKWMEPVLPDQVEDCGHFRRHLFKPSSVALIRAAVDYVTRPAGRPWPKRKEEGPAGRRR